MYERNKRFSIQREREKAGKILLIPLTYPRTLGKQEPRVIRISTHEKSDLFSGSCRENSLPNFYKTRVRILKILEKEKET